MLKLNYTDYGLFLERVATSLDVVATQRVMLAVYTGEPLHLEPSRAAFLLPVSDPEVTPLVEVLQEDTTGAIALTVVDINFVEVSLKGTWIANSASAEAGTFITVLPPQSELLIARLWQMTQQPTAYST